jgi:starch synthase/alpha-amylase
MLFQKGANVHVALPDYRRIISRKLPPDARSALYPFQDEGPEQRLHLAKDREFFYLDHLSPGNGSDNLKRALRFQRELINNVLPYVQPDFIHCHDWMTGLIPAVSRKMDIPCLFTFNHLSTARCPLSLMEDIGIDAAFFWSYLYYDRYPENYEESRDSNPVDLLLSGIFAANRVSTGSPTFMNETIENRHGWINAHLRHEISRKWETGCGIAIPNAPDSSYNPATDRALFMRYCAKDHYPAKQHNKLFLQEKLGLAMDSRAPVFFWPSRLDPFWKGCEILASIFSDLLSGYESRNLQVVFVADGNFKSHFEEIVASHHLQDRVRLCDFEERLARQAYAASDFVLIPSSVEPGGFPHMIGPIYGSLPVAYDSGALHDSLAHMDVSGNTGNGFLFRIYDPEGLSWAIKEAMVFYDLPCREKSRQIERIMAQSTAAFNQTLTVSRYIELYETMLERPLFTER